MKTDIDLNNKDIFNQFINSNVYFKNVSFRNKNAHVLIPSPFLYIYIYIYYIYIYTHS